jgi:hypothetical protein
VNKKSLHGTFLSCSCNVYGNETKMEGTERVHISIRPSRAWLADRMRSLLVRDLVMSKTTGL